MVNAWVVVLGQGRVCLAWKRSDYSSLVPPSRPHVAIAAAAAARPQSGLTQNVAQLAGSPPPKLDTTSATSSFSRRQLTIELSDRCQTSVIGKRNLQSAFHGLQLWHFVVSATRAALPKSLHLAMRGWIVDACWTRATLRSNSLCGLHHVETECAARLTEAALRWHGGQRRVRDVRTRRYEVF